MFQHARIKLTLWYLLIIMAISVSFSTVIYTMINREFERFARSQRFKIEQQMQKESAIERFRIQNETPPPPIMDPELITETRHRLIWNLVMINSLICLLSSILGYMLAGKTLRPIQTMIDEQNQFITDASHELRTPLTSMKSAVEVALRDKKQTMNDMKTILEDNIHDINKLERLSDQLLTLAHFEQPNGTMPMEPFPLSESLDQAIKNIDSVRKSKSIHIQEPKILPSVSILGYKDEITSVFTIILDNAIKYSPEKTDIILKTKVQNTKIEIGVQDQGIGITKNDLPHIFDRFYRADPARTKSDANGYGLGLAIAKKIIEKHHGTIECQSTVGKGSTFTLRFPTLS